MAVITLLFVCVEVLILRLKVVVRGGVGDCDKGFTIVDLTLPYAGDCSSGTTS
jgi:hypothetical protein